MSKAVAQWPRKALYGVWGCLIGSWQIVVGVYRLSRLQGPIISIFGGKGAWEGGKYAFQATQLAEQCVASGFSVLTGGGPGIMEAANCGALAAKQHKKERWSLGIGVTGVDIGYTNPCAPVYTVSYFFVRKWLLLRYSRGFAIFPGGIGTVNEFFSLLDLFKLKKIKRVPVVLIGKEYWQPLVDWYRHALEKEFIKQDGSDLFVLVDSHQEALTYLQATFDQAHKDG